MHACGRSCSSQAGCGLGRGCAVTPGVVHAARGHAIRWRPPVLIEARRASCVAPRRGIARGMKRGQPGCSRRLKRAEAGLLPPEVDPWWRRGLRYGPKDQPSGRPTHRLTLPCAVLVRLRSEVETGGVSGLPAGTVSMLFSDIEGSTRLLSRMGG